jgi:hypothetical protein
MELCKVLIDSGKEFTDRLFASRKHEPSGRHEACVTKEMCQVGIEHHLTKLRTPCTNGWLSDSTVRRVLRRRRIGMCICTIIGYLNWPYENARSSHERQWYG